MTLPIDSARAGERLVNQRLADVAFLRGQHDVHIVTDDKEQLPRLLARVSSHAAALQPGRNPRAVRDPRRMTLDV